MPNLFDSICYFATIKDTKSILAVAVYIIILICNLWTIFHCSSRKPSGKIYIVTYYFTSVQLPGASATIISPILVYCKAGEGTKEKLRMETKIEKYVSIQIWSINTTFLFSHFKRRIDCEFE